MAQLVSTGQITIVDTNDARTITAVLVANGATQQIYTKDESTVTYVPSWFTTNLVITPQIAIGGMTSAQAWAALSGKKFVYTPGGAEITTDTTLTTAFVNNSDQMIDKPFLVTNVPGASTASTIAIKGNLRDSVAAFTLFFEADYIDPATTLSTHITCQITLTTVKTGTNAVFITLRGQTYIEEATGNLKNNIAVAADLVRSSGIDSTGLSYKWYEDGGGVQITKQLGSYSKKYGVSTSAAGTVPVPAATALNGDIPGSEDLPVTPGTGNGYNTLTINESAVTDIEIYKVEITDADGKTYASYFTIYDLSDPYDVRILSSTGDKLLNGQGSTVLTPQVFYGSTQISPLTDWSFAWQFYDRDGKRGAFIDTSKISVAGGAPITSNTAYGTPTANQATFTYSGTPASFAVGNVIKVVKPNGQAFFYEVKTATSNNTIIIGQPTGASGLSFTDYPAPTTVDEFKNGRLFGCVMLRTTMGTAAPNSGSITLTGDEVDSKARILVEASRP